MIPEDYCPVCRHNLGGQAFDEEKWAGSIIECGGCATAFEIQEHSDGWTNWMSFHEVEARAPREGGGS